MDNNKNTCKNCIWFEQCGCDSICQYYDPASEQESDDKIEEEYNEDLKFRARQYGEQVKEQDS